MPLNGVVSSAVSNLQTSLRSVADGLSNADASRAARSAGATVPAAGVQTPGVNVAQLRLAADQFLQSAHLSANADVGKAGAASDIWDQVQGLFGDPADDASLVSNFETAAGALSSLAAEPTSGAAKAAAADQTSRALGQANVLSGQLQGLSAQVDLQIGATVDTANQLLSQIDALNADVSRANIAAGGDTAPQAAQNQLIDQLSGLLDIRVASLRQTGLTVRAGNGAPLAGDGAATLNYDGSGAKGEITTTTPGAEPRSLSARLQGGALKGLLDLRNVDLPGLSGQLSALAGQTSDALGLANQTASDPDAPKALTASAQAISDSAQALGRQVAGRAAASAADQISAAAVASEAASRRSSVGPVSLDQEFSQLSTYQQAYNASTRMVQAVKDMHNALLTVAA